MLVVPFRLLLPNHLNTFRLDYSEEVVGGKSCARMIDARGTEIGGEDEEFEVKRLRGCVDLLCGVEEASLKPEVRGRLGPVGKNPSFVHRDNKAEGGGKAG